MFHIAASVASKRLATSICTKVPHSHYLRSSRTFVSKLSGKTARFLTNEDLVKAIMKKTRRDTPDQVSVRVVTDGDLPGVKSGSVVSLAEAIKASIKNEMDIIGVSIEQDVPVVKVASMSAVAYKQQTKKTKAVSEKEVRFTSNIADNDYGRKINNVIQHLQKGNRCVVRVRCKYHDLKDDPDICTTIFNKVTEEVKDYGEPLKPPKLNPQKTNGQVTFAPRN